VRAVRQLQQQVACSKGRGGKGRRRTLQAQIERLEDWLGGGEWLEGGVRKNQVCDTETVEGAVSALAAVGESPAGEWSAFFPFLNLWDPL
jgi:hypothetical protein